MDIIRQAAVENSFYPGNANELREMVEGFLNDVRPILSKPPKAIIAPHAGYIYSGPIAASAYCELGNTIDAVKRIIIMGPSHRVAFYGLAISEADFFNTPLGNIPVDKKIIQALLDQNLVSLLNSAHQQEHSLEVQLPFLQIIYKNISIVPIVVGEATAQEVSRCLQAVWGGSETLIVVSSDLSHYHPYEQAKILDKNTSGAIEKYDIDAIHAEDACGYIPIRGLLACANNLNLKEKTLDCRNSGDTAGSKDQVVGYGAYAFI